jgi:hypothetical protein
MAVIEAIFYWAGDNWNAEIDLQCTEKGILHIAKPEQLVDIIAIVRVDGLEPQRYKIAIECKARDFASSVFGHEVSADLEAELKGDGKYLKLRAAKEFNEVVVFVAGVPTKRDGSIHMQVLYRFFSLMGQHRIPAKLYLNIKEAVTGIIEFLEEYWDPVDLSIPPYENWDKSFSILERQNLQIDGVTKDNVRPITNVEIRYIKREIDHNEFKDELLDVIGENVDGSDPKLLTDIYELKVLGIEPKPKPSTRKTKQTKPKVKEC